MTVRMMIGAMALVMASAGFAASGGGGPGSAGGGPDRGGSERMDRDQMMDRDRTMEHRDAQRPDGTPMRDQDRDRPRDGDEDRARMRDQTGPIYGQQLMSEREIRRYQDRWTRLRSEDQKARFLEQHRERMDRRARRENVTLEPPGTGMREQERAQQQP